MLIARAAAGEIGCCLRLVDEVLISLAGAAGAGDAFAFSALCDLHSRATYSLARRE